MKTISFLCGNLSGGGAQRVIIILANYFCNNGCKVNLFISEVVKQKYEIDEKVNIILLPTSKGALLKTVKRYLFLKKFVKQNGTDVLISFVFNIELCYLLSLRKKYAIISSTRDDPDFVFKSYPLKKPFIMGLYNNSDKIVFQTTDQMMCFGSKIRKKGVIICNPMKTDLPLVDVTGDIEKVFVNFCRLTPEKGLSIFLDGFAKFIIDNPNHKDFSVFIYGDGSQREELLAIIEKNNLTGQAHILPFNTKIHSLIKDKYCFVSTSRTEGLSNSMLEAMAMGMPVICTDCDGGGARQYIKSYENGILIPKDDAEALAQAMKFMADNPEKAQAMGREAARIKDDLTIEKIGKMWLDVIEEVYNMPQKKRRNKKV